MRQSRCARADPQDSKSLLTAPYLLGLELCDPGFNHTVLSKFRSRLLAHGTERRLFDAVLALAQTQGLLQAGGRQRSDSTHVLGKIRMLGRYELVAETLHHALDVP